MIETFDFGGHAVAYQEKGKGPCVLMLHGWPTNAHLWQSQMEILSDTHRVVAIDWLGFGASDKPERHQYSFSSMAAVLNELITVLLQPQESVTLIGHDIGGPPAVIWAAANPHRVERIVLLNTMLYTFHTPLDRVSELLFKVPGLKHLMASDYGLRRIVKSNTKSQRTGLNAVISRLTIPFRNSKTNFILRMISEPMRRGRRNELLELAATLEKLSVNKHLVIAPEDPLCGKHMLQFHRNNPEVDVHFLEGCGHYLPIDQPERLNDVLRGILES